MNTFQSVQAPILIVARALLVVTCCFLSSCGVRSVLYGEVAHQYAATTNDQVTRVYFDQEGSLYPAAASGVKVDNQRLEYHKGMLQYYYQFDYGRPKNSSSVPASWASAQASELAALQTYYQKDGAVVATTPNDSHTRDQAWRTLQLAMQKQFIDHLGKSLNSAQALVVLVHGYNNDVDQAEWYLPLEKRIQNEYFAGKKIHFLEVRWDGRTASVPFSIWPYAQYSMYPVGLGLRRILSSLDPQLPVYIIGHSTGAPLICATLWNCTSALQQKSPPMTVWGEDYTSLITKELYRTPQPAHLRVALIAPAMPGLHFRDFGKRTPSLPTGTPPPDGYDRFVLAQNRHDIATGKWILPASWGKGSTTLGVRKKEYCENVVPGIHDSHSKTESYLLDFTQGMKDNNVRNGHGVMQFMQNGASFKCLLNAWLADPIGVPPPCAETCP